MNQTTSKSSLGEWSQRLLAAIFLGGQVLVHLLRGKIHRRNTLEQMAAVGPDSLFIALLTAIFVGAVFTIQVAREFINFGAGNIIGGVLSIALTRELSPVLTAVVLAGRVGSAFAAEIGTMRVTEQIDAMLMLKTDPIDYLVIPRVIACCLMLPILTLLSLITGMFGGFIIATNVYNLSDTVFLDSARNFLGIWDIISAMLKACCFGILIAVIGCSWGLTTTGGAKGVGQSTTTAVVTALLIIFVSNFFLSWLMFQGLGSAFLKGL
ncbi:MlaE family lipid ABC transporter permease subunit [Nostoc sp. UCD121]|uniref:MlaE family lipid ABC transporter permease subunit n=1 Tax=unclassified Nostoc TaxID=2593658 RepID=UPI000DECE100|nr:MULTISPECIES: MlaE family lipid ABC transporter permease subunit [unclassified Nostoc]MBC1297293.1 MlaE family lipid ABC transporter permease subunit [Nostoc sp. UCD122]MBC1223116.1 MlaE family lipid ABC transporter permease subunit [Nostoc sp. UCD120]MBC1275725.1 MlaE family lipid ABC transporter permease subunit [Nostoc sp. UCD121]QHG17822.1 MlaE family lipid ABC transporter permease subunit [Nostoc sp. ATCC 53789]RCJ26322.1 ABC transporter permease [Nostoc sp. ATCC 53789]